MNVPASCLSSSRPWCCLIPCKHGVRAKPSRLRGGGGRTRRSSQLSVIGIRLESVTHLPQGAVSSPKNPCWPFLSFQPFPQPCAQSFPNTKAFRIYDAVHSLSIPQCCSVCLGCLSLLCCRDSPSFKTDPGTFSKKYGLTSGSTLGTPLDLYHGKAVSTSSCLG